MNDLDTRLRETLHRVAESTRTTHQVDGIMFPQPRRRVGIMVAAAAFAFVVTAIGIPVLFLNGGADPGSVDVAADPSGTSVPAVIDPAWLTVDDDDFAVFEELRAEGASVHGEGWRPSLRTESVWCMHLEGPGADTTASEFPIEQDLTREVIEVECATGNDPARNLESPPEIFTFCRGVLARDAYREWTTAGEQQVIEGDLDADRPGFPVVLGWDSDCTSEQLDTSWSVGLTPDLSLEAINRARQVEIAVTGAANTNCFSYEQAHALATAARQELGDSWLITETTSLDATIEGACYQPIIDQQWGAIYVLGNDRLTSTTLGSATSTTVAPTTGDDSELRARTGTFGEGGEEGTGENIRLDAPDAPEVILDLAAGIELPPGASF